MKIKQLKKGWTIIPDRLKEQEDVEKFVKYLQYSYCPEFLMEGLRIANRERREEKFSLTTDSPQVHVSPHAPSIPSEYEEDNNEVRLSE